MNKFVDTLCYIPYRIYYRTVDYLGDVLRGRRIRWWVQRRRRGFDDRELWSLDSTITDFVYPRLKAFNGWEKTGLSGCFFEDPDKMDHDEADWEYAWTKQKEIYDKIELAFDYMIRNGMDVDSGFDHEKYSDMNDALENSDKEQWEVYKKELDRRSIVIKEGLHLFAEYYHTLWD